jgi:hypothetical protein
MGSPEVAGGVRLDWTQVMLGALHQRFRRTSPSKQRLTMRSRTCRTFCLIPKNDIAQVHRYLDLGARLEVCHGPMDVLAADAVTTLLGFHAGKPVLLAESGAVEPSHSGPFKLYSQDKAGILLHDVLFAPFFAGAAGPGHCWHWDSYVAKNDLWYHFGRFAQAVTDIDPPAEQFRPLRIEHPRLRVYALAGRHTFLAWCRDTQNTWQTELAEARRGESERPVLRLPADIAQEHAARVRITIHGPTRGRRQDRRW